MESKQEPQQEQKYKLQDSVLVEFDKNIDKWRLSNIGGFVTLPEEVFTIIFEEGTV